MKIQVQNVVSGYGDSEILHGASLDVEDGQITAILGPNGAGKTTLLKTIMGILRARSGKVYFEGRDITKNPHFRDFAEGGCIHPTGKKHLPSIYRQG